MNEAQESYRVIGIMSGTSLDGVDLAACLFTRSANQWEYRVESAVTYPYTREWIQRLQQLPASDAYLFCETDIEYGRLLGMLANRFMAETGFKPGLIASHGHTIFHRPEAGVTVQIGAGSAIAAETGLEVACDFRSADVAQGGQGAPLVPIGDRLLFSGYDACLNLGGFGNISFDMEDRRVAFDTCPVNMVLNLLAMREGLAYDDRGKLAASGKLIPGLLEKWNDLVYYHQPYPKSLGREWFEKEFLPVAASFQAAANDLSRTACEHIAIQVSRNLPDGRRMKVLVTGGGTRHEFLLGCIRRLSRHEFIVPDDITIDYKEAIIFAFLGLLRQLGEVNILRTVTGGRQDICSGGIYRI